MTAVAGFTSPLRLEKIGSRRWKLLCDLIYVAKNGDVFIAKEGCETDLASIPRGLWNILPPIGDYDFAAVLHDSRYTAQDVTRARADALLLEAMEATHVGWFTRHTIYAAVRVGGAGIWKKHAEDKAERERRLNAFAADDGDAA